MRTRFERRLPERRLGMGAAAQAFVGRAGERFEAYVERLAQAVGHADRRCAAI